MEMSLGFFLKHIRGSIVPAAALTSATLLLVVLAIQYPLSTTFPIGGDAADYIETAQLLVAAPLHPENLRELTGDWYPVANLIFIPFGLLPFDWPIRFIWWAAVGQISVGIAFGWLLYRIASWHVAAAGIAVWALTPIVATRHFEDGTIAQLWSYVFLFLFLERYHSMSRWWALVLLPLTFLTHPITGLALLLAVLVSLIPQWVTYPQMLVGARKMLVVFTILIGIGVVSIAGMLFYRRDTLQYLTIMPDDFSPLEYLRSTFAPVFLLAPFGLIVMLEQLKKSVHSLLLLASVAIVFVLLSINNLLGVHVWVNRLIPLFVLILSLGAAFSWPWLIRHIFSYTWLRVGLTCAFFATLGAIVWQSNAQVYAYYESPSRYARIHPDELAAIAWLRDTLPADSSIYSTIATRHTEWIDVLTPHQWLPLSSQSAIEEVMQPVLLQTKPPVGVSYFVLFLRGENLPDIIRDNPEIFPTVYHNDSTVIVQVPRYAAE